MLKYGWFTSAQCCAFLDVSPNHFTKRLVPRILGDFIDKSQKPYLYRGRAVLNAYMDLNRPVDEMLVGDSEDPNIVRWRKARADILEAQRDEKLNLLMQTQDVDLALSRLADGLKSCARNLERTFGEDARQMLDDVLEAFAREIDSLEASPVLNGNGQPENKGVEGSTTLVRVEESVAEEADLRGVRGAGDSAAGGELREPEVPYP